MLRLGITGANGFIGLALANASLTRGHHVTAIILPGLQDGGLAKAGARVVPLALRDGPELRSAFDGLDVLVNLAGNMLGASSRLYREANIETVRGVVAAIAGLPRPPRLIQISSVAALGPSPDGRPLAEDAHPHPVSIYGRTKLSGETIALGRPGSLVVRPPSIYGPGDRCFLELFQWARRGLFPLLCTRSKRFNLLFREDLIGLLLEVIARPDLSGILHLGHPVVHSAADLAAALGSAAGRTLRPVFLPRGAVSLLARVSSLPERVGAPPALMSPGKVEEMSRSCWLQDFSRSAPLVAATGGRYQTTLSEGIATTMAWYRKNGWA